MPLRIALSGKMASGKSTLARELERRLPGCVRLSFASAIRAIIVALHGPGRTKDRALLTGIGTLHRSFDPDTWLNVVRREAAACPPDCPLVLDDLRFQNELAGLRRDGWVVVRLRASRHQRARHLEHCLLYTSPSPRDS